MNIAISQGIYAITDCINCSYTEVLEKSEIIMRHGTTLFQYRDKTNNFETKFKLANELKSLCSQFNIPFIINDDIDLTKKISADGVHLGRYDQKINIARRYLGNIIIGASCYNDLNRAINAEKSGADYVTFGSFYPSPTKPDAIIANIDLLKYAKKKINLPIVAIGGITPENGNILIKADVNFLAVISGLYLAKDTIQAIKTYTKLFKNN